MTLRTHHEVFLEITRVMPQGRVCDHRDRYEVGYKAAMNFETGTTFCGLNILPNSMQRQHESDASKTEVIASYQ